MLTISEHKYYPILQKSAMIFLSLLIFVTIGEIFFRIYFRYNLSYDIEMTKYADMVKTDSDNPSIGHEHKINITAKLMNVLVHTNSDGFRDNEYSPQRNDKYRIILLGDSLTFGWGVEKDDTFAKLLEKEISLKQPTEIINFGTGNYNTQQEVNLLMEKGLEYRPDKVVVFYSINDAEPTPKKSSLWLLGKSYFFTFYWSKIKSVYDSYVLHSNYLTYYSGLYKDNPAGWQKTKQGFLQLKQIALDKHFDLQVVLLPDLHKLDDFPFKKEHLMVTNFLTDNHIDSLDLAPNFKDWSDSQKLWVAKDDSHPNKLAHKLIAEYTKDFIEKK